jgi:hypothetical protein
LLKSIKEFLTKNVKNSFSTDFQKEVGQDEGGLTREFFDLVGKEM